MTKRKLLLEADLSQAERMYLSIGIGLLYYPPKSQEWNIGIAMRKLLKPKRPLIKVSNET